MTDGAIRGPYPADWSVAQALETYLRENGFTKASYTERFTEVAVWKLKFYLPNTKAHARALRLHDLHHAITGFGTDLAGEGEISAWEVRRGLRGLDLYVTLVVLLAGTSGFVMAPIRAIRAFRRSGGGRNLFADERDYEDLLAMNLGDLRVSLGVPRDGIAERRGLHSAAPAMTG